MLDAFSQASEWGSGRRALFRGGGLTWRLETPTTKQQSLLVAVGFQMLQQIESQIGKCLRGFRIADGSVSLPHYVVCVFSRNSRRCFVRSCTELSGPAVEGMMMTG